MDLTVERGSPSFASQAGPLNVQSGKASLAFSSVILRWDIGRTPGPILTHTHTSVRTRRRASNARL